MSVNSLRLSRALEARSGGSEISSAKSSTNIRNSVFSSNSSASHLSTVSRRQLASAAFQTNGDYGYASSISSESSAHSGKKLFERGRPPADGSPKVSLTASASLEQVAEIDQTTPHISQVPDFGYSISPSTPLDEEDEQKSSIDSTRIVNPSTPIMSRVDYDLEDAMINAMIKSTDTRDLKSTVDIPTHKDYVFNPHILPTAHTDAALKSRSSNTNSAAVSEPATSPMHVVTLSKDTAQPKGVATIMKKALRRVAR